MMVNSFLMIKLYIMKILQLTTFLFFITQLNAQNSDKPSWTADYSKSKSFIENLGQFDEFETNSTGKIEYAVDFGSTRILFGKKGISYNFLEARKIPRAERERIMNSPVSSIADHKSKEKLVGKFMFKQDAVNMTWLNPSTSTQLITSEETSDYHNYSVKNSAGEYFSVSNAKAYKKLTYKNIYSNIDIEYVVHPEIGIKYAIIVHPGANPSDVAMVFDRDISLLDGKIDIPTEFGSIIDHAPLTFYQGDNSNIIPSSFKQEQNTIRFSVGNYDNTQTLIIDPWTQTPAFNTNWDVVWEVEKDGAGNVYILGGIMPMQILKYNSTGALQWTYNTPYDTSNVWLGTFAVDLTGISYVTAGSVAQIQKVSAAGAMLLNNASPGGIFSSAEFWTIAFNCDQTGLIIGGTGGTVFPPVLDAVIYDVNTSTLNINNEQFISNGPTLAFPPDVEEVRSIAAGPNGKYYFMTHDTIGYMNDNFNLCPNNSSSFYKNNHGMGYGYKCEDFRYDNAGIMGIRADANAVYTHRGNQLQKRSLTTGAILSSVAIPGGGYNNVFLSGNQVTNSGIDIDNCGNIYVGSTTGVYKFNSSLVQQAFYATSFKVYDVVVSLAGDVIACGGTGTSNSTSRSGGVQSFFASACAPIAATCCDATICIPEDFCVNDAPFTFTTATSGGTWSGPGVNASGVFNPTTAGAGTHTITYTLACGSETISVVVNPCATLSVCVETNGTLTVSNGTPAYTWSNQTTVTTPINNQASCVACGGTATMIGPIYISCSVGTSCTSTVWTAFGTGTNQTVNTYPVQIVDGIGTTLLINSVSGLPACGSVPCPTITLNTTAQTNVACFGNNTGSATVNATGGAAAYTYTWLPGNLNGASQSNLAAGTYTVNVVDANLCPGSGTVTITQPAAALSVSMANTPATCGANNGTATVTTTGGTTTYSYVWSPSGGAGATATNLAAGAYSVLVTDLNGCQITGNTTVPSSGGPSISVSTSTGVSCFGGTNGSATVSGSGGTGTLSYNWMPGGLTGASQSALSAGTYTVTVTDQGGCSNSTTVTINEPTELTLSAGTINPANCGTTDGSASVIASGGTGTLSYTWSPNVSSSASATNIAAGSYTVTVQDLNLCSETINIVVTSIGGPTVTLASSNDASCYGGNDGDATINVTGGTAPFTYVWSPSGGSGVSATNLSAGTYSASVTDDQGCVGSVNVIIGSPTQIVITETITDIICGSSLGQISTSVTGGDGTYSYDWLPNGETTSGISGLAVGTYSLEVTDGSGCSVLENYVISTSGTLTIVATPASTTINAGESVQLNASGATTYTWSPATGLSATDISDPIATPTSSITYTVTGSDANGCVGTALVNIYIPIDCGELFLPTVFSPNGTGPSSNNVLCVLGGCIAELNYTVYNRWGEKVFETTDNTICWDGMFKDKPVNSGVYAYKIYAVLFDGTTIEESGNLTIVR